MHHLHFSHLAVLEAALVQFLLGAVWYSLIFAKPWMAYTGHTKGEKPKGIVAAMILSAIGALIFAFMLAHVVSWAGATTVGWGVFVGFICWLGFIVPALFAETIYERRPYGLFAINSGYWLTALVVSSALLATWH